MKVTHESFRYEECTDTSKEFSGWDWYFQALRSSTGLVWQWLSYTELKQS